MFVLLKKQITKQFNFATVNSELLRTTRERLAAGALNHKQAGRKENKWRSWVVRWDHAITFLNSPSAQNDTDVEQWGVTYNLYDFII